MKNEVTVKSDSKGYLRFCIPTAFAQQYWGKKQNFISFGAKNNEANKAEAYQKRNELQKDLENGTFNPHNLDKYKHSSKQKKAVASQQKEISLLDLYDQFTEYQCHSLSIGVVNDYRKTYRNAIKDCAEVNIYSETGQFEINKHLRETRCPNIQIRVLGILNKAMEWGIENGILPKNTVNNFLSYQQKARKLPKTKKAQIKALENKLKDHEKRAWTKTERDIIMDAFNHRKINSSYFRQCDVVALLVEFLFLTGLRHGEAYGLKWGKVKWSNEQEPYTYAYIDTSYHSKQKVFKETKNRKVRNLRLSQRAVEILKQLKAFYESIGRSTNDADLVFQNSQGNPFNTTYFASVWRGSKRNQGIVVQLVEERKLEHYIDFYSTRRTFASLQAQAGIDPRTVADYIGDNVETVLKHYYRGREDYVPVEI